MAGHVRMRTVRSIGDRLMLMRIGSPRFTPVPEKVAASGALANTPHRVGKCRHGMARASQGPGPQRASLDSTLRKECEVTRKFNPNPPSRKPRD
jgi:hypothetical protein